MPVPVPIPMPPGADEDGKIAVYKALSKLCGGGAQAVAGTMTSYSEGAFSWLQESEYQIMVSLFVMVIGGLAAYEGASFYQVLYHLVISILAACITKYEMEGSGSDLGEFWQAVVICEVTFVLALATMHGFEGSQILFGVVFGLLVAHGLGAWAREAESWFQGIGFVWYSAGALFGGLVFTVWRRMLLCALAPLFGSFLVASGLCTATSHSLSFFAGTSFVFLPTPSTDWGSAAHQLLGASAGRGALAGACAGAFLSLLIKGYGTHDPHKENKKLLISVGCLLAYVVVIAVVAVASLGPDVNVLWPLFGCFSWALLTALTASRQLKTIDDAEIRDSFLAAGHLVPDALNRWREEAQGRRSDLDEENAPLTGRRGGGGRRGGRGGGRGRGGGDRSPHRDGGRSGSPGGGRGSPGGGAGIGSFLRRP